MKIEHDRNENSGEFYIEENEERIAELAYSLPEKGKLVINHTEVDEKLEGKGVGKKLVIEAVKYARENHLKVVPVCTFAKLIINRDKELQDVL